MKYVIIDNCFPIIFSVAHAHKDFKNMGGVITSAGFCRIVTTTLEGPSNPVVVVYGLSASLNLRPDRDNDERILNKLMELGNE